jgi:hypothetical protein
MKFKKLYALLINPLFSIKRRNVFAFGFILSLVLLSLYVFQTQVVISREYEIRNSQELSRDLVKSKSYLELEVLGHVSLTNLEKKISNLDFIGVEEIKYINLSDDYLVKLAE